MRPVFIGGCERSGTTLLASLFARSPRVCVTPESQFKVDMHRALFAASRTACWEDVASFLHGDFRFQLWALPDDWLKALHGETNLGDVMAAIVNRYSIMQGATQIPHFWIDHTPNNVEYAKTLAASFPEAKFLHIVRDGRAVAASVMPLDWGPNTILECATWWTAHLAYGLALERHFGQHRVRRVRFEDIVSDPDRSIQELSTFLGIDVSGSESFGGVFEVPSYTKSQHALVGSDIDPRRATSWMDTLSSREIALFEWRTKELLCYLEYDLVSPPCVPPTLLERCALKLRETVRRYGFNPRKNRHRRAGR